MLLALILFPMCALLGALGLYACSRTPTYPPLILPVIRTASLLCAAAVYTAWIWKR